MERESMAEKSFHESDAHLICKALSHTFSWSHRNRSPQRVGLESEVHVTSSTTTERRPKSPTPREDTINGYQATFVETVTDVPTLPQRGRTARGATTGYSKDSLSKRELPLKEVGASSYRPSFPKEHPVEPTCDLQVDKCGETIVTCPGEELPENNNATQATQCPNHKFDTFSVATSPIPNVSRVDLAAPEESHPSETMNSCTHSWSIDDSIFCTPGRNNLHVCFREHKLFDRARRPKVSSRRSARVTGPKGPPDTAWTTYAERDVEFPKKTQSQELSDSYSLYRSKEMDTIGGSQLRLVGEGNLAEDQDNIPPDIIIEKRSHSEESVDNGSAGCSDYHTHHEKQEQEAYSPSGGETLSRFADSSVTAADDTVPLHEELLNACQAHISHARPAVITSAPSRRAFKGGSHVWNTSDTAQGAASSCSSILSRQPDQDYPTPSDDTPITAAASDTVRSNGENLPITKKEVLLYHTAIALTLLTVGPLVLYLQLAGGSTRATSITTVLDSNTKDGTAVLHESAPEQSSTETDEARGGLMAVSTAQLYDMCMTPPCQQEGSYLNDLIVRGVDPCDDFYQFVCGRWKARNETKEQPTTCSNDDSLVLRLETKTRSLLSSRLPKDEHKILLPLKNFFEGCLRVTEDDRHLTPLLELLSAVSLEGFPFTPPVRHSVPVWRIAARVLALAGTSVLLTVGVSAHPFDKRRSLISADLPIQRVNRLNDTLTSAYNKVTRAALNALKKRLVRTSQVSEVVDFALRLDALAQEKNIRKHRVVPIREVPEVAVFLAELLSQDLPDKMVILLRAPAYTRQLVAVINNTESHVLMNFLGVQVVVQNAVFVPALDADLTRASTYLTFGEAAPRGVPRWRTCLRLSQAAMPYLLLYASKSVGTTIRTSNATRNLLEDIRNVLLETLDTITVMDEPTLTFSKDIFAKTKFRAFAPSWLSEEERLQAYINDLPNISPSYVLKYFSLAHSASLSFSLRLPFWDTWTGDAFATSCWYDLQSNTVFIPTLAFDFSLPGVRGDTLILQLPRGGLRVVSCMLQMLFEGLSSHYSHEILVRSWWTPEANRRLLKAQQCLKEQLSVQATPPSLLVSVASLAPALELYQDYVRRRPKGHTDVRLPLAEDFDAVQQFFIYFALGLCERRDGWCVHEGVEKGRYGGARPLNATLKNTEVLAHAFRCRTVSRPRSSLLCSVWRRETA